MIKRYTIIKMFAVLLVYPCIFFGAEVSFPDTSVITGETFLLPIITSELTGLGAVSYDAVIQYDQTLLDYIDIVQIGTLSANLLMDVKDSTSIGELRFGAVNAFPLEGAGILLFLRFMAKSQTGQASVSFISFMFNESISETRDGTVTVDFTTSIDSDGTDNNDGTTGLSSYPNPFNNSVVISYRLTSAQFIEIDLYTITGKKIKTLDRAVRSSGGHTVLWNGMSDNGNPVGSGLYFCTLRSKESLKTLKITLVK